MIACVRLASTVNVSAAHSSVAHHGERRPRISFEEHVVRVGIAVSVLVALGAGWYRPAVSSTSPTVHPVRSVSTNTAVTTTPSAGTTTSAAPLPKSSPVVTHLARRAATCVHRIRLCAVNTAVTAFPDILDTFHASGTDFNQNNCVPDCASAHIPLPRQVSLTNPGQYLGGSSFRT